MEYIIEYENALELSECDKIIDLFENNKELQFEGFFGDSKIDKSFKISYEMFLYVFNDFEKKMNLFLYPYYLKYLEKAEFIKNAIIINERWKIQKYKKNEGFFNWHVDNSATIYKNRLLAVIYYLNDVEEGGETLFKIDGKIKSVKPKKGKLVIFPANFCYVHKGNMPISNDKYILVTFLNIKDLN